MAKKKAAPVTLNDGYYQEAMDRCDVINQIIDGILLSHPVIDQTPAWKKNVEKAQELIGKVYQNIGNKTK